MKRTGMTNTVASIDDNICLLCANVCLVFMLRQLWQCKCLKYYSAKKKNFYGAVYPRLTSTSRSTISANTLLNVHHGQIIDHHTTGVHTEKLFMDLSVFVVWDSTKVTILANTARILCCLH